MIERIPVLSIWALAAISALTLGVSAGRVFWHVSGEFGAVRAAQRPTGANEAEQRDIAPILALSPFGSEVAPPADPQIAGETSLGLTLLGVTIANPSAGSRAIISGGDSPAHGYFVGEIITASSSLSSIEPDHVVLNVDGRLETLSFEKADVAVVPTSGKGPDLRNLIPSTTAATAPNSGTNNPDEVIAGYRSAIQMDAQGVMNRLGLEVTDQGYRITEGASAGVRQAGFRAGDVVTSVNGKKVGDMAADQVYFDEVAASGRARVELLRDGQKIIMSFPLR